ncbi:hypothetical protein LMG27952_07703 [Paraburkholderia hiiakae]|uniref:Peptidase C39-like domain-containing protein n=1 Tax=Paraburkholderia hiiakae TaxID=1081782 RepID=A0ABN7IJG5_9BURK|nr:hypothetical protein [Paraburkholderia hiiakae]CAD6562178.1 hypothetical protein LMG27952_07703 [Paraburkholderia hiiakae]
MPKITPDALHALASKIASGNPPGRVLDPIPIAQTQEGPTCGFYALSIVMDYWKAKGRTQTSVPARKRDVDVQDRDEAEKQQPSLRNLGKAVGALDVNGVVKRSTGGVWTAKQLAAVARAVKTENYYVRLKTWTIPGSFIGSICNAIDAGIPPIVAFDVQDGDPVPDAGGQKSHWGVIIGYFMLKNALWFIATHGHGSYYCWLAITLQQSNFALVGTTYHQQAAIKISIAGEGLSQLPEKYTRTQWVKGEEASKAVALIVDQNRPLEMNAVETREPFDVAQDLGRHIVLVEPSS